MRHILILCGWWPQSSPLAAAIPAGCGMYRRRTHYPCFTWTVGGSGNEFVVVAVCVLQLTLIGFTQRYCEHSALFDKGHERQRNAGD